MFLWASCSASWRTKSLLHLKIWTLLGHLFDLFRALQEGLFFLIGGVYMLGGHSIPYYWYCQCVCHSTTITSFMGQGKQYCLLLNCYYDSPRELSLRLHLRQRSFSSLQTKWGQIPWKRERVCKHTSIKEKIKLMKHKQKSSHLMFLIKSKIMFHLT